MDYVVNITNEKTNVSRRSVQPQRALHDGRTPSNRKHSRRPVDESRRVHLQPNLPHPPNRRGIGGTLPPEWDFWQGYDTAILTNCEKVIVLRLPGWQESTGVQAEIKLATEMGLPIDYIDFTDTPYYDAIIERCKVNENLKEHKTS